MARVVLENVVKKFNDQTIVRGLDLDIKDGEFVVLVGPSGCGKSTTLRMIVGLEDLTSGQIKIGDRVVNDLDPKDRDIAMVFQSYALYPHLNVFDNMAFGLKLRSVFPSEISSRVNSVAETLDITHLLKRKPKELSGGQRQRVAMGRAIVRQPEVFLFDEPLSNLDAQLRTKMRIEIKKLMRKLGTTAIYVTHDQTEAMTMADRIVILNQGLVEQIGTPTELYDLPANTFVAQFIGNPSMNLIESKLLNSFPTQQPCIVGMRPQDFVLGESKAVRFSGQTTVAEVLGGSTLMEIDCGQHSLLALVQGHQNHLEHQRVSISIDREAIHQFDLVTKQRI